MPAQDTPRRFWTLAAITLAIMVIMNVVGAPLNNPAAPSGIVTYELAGTLAKSQAILASWDARARQFAAFGLGFDYVFMLAYAALFSISVRLAGRTLAAAGYPLASMSGRLAGGQWLAAGLDAVENLALTVMLLGTPANPWPQVAAVCAAIKFGLLFLGLVYAFYGLAIWGGGKIARK